MLEAGCGLFEFIRLVVDVEAGFFEGEGCGSDHAGFVAEASGEDAEVLLKSGTELGPEVLFERVEEKIPGFGDSAADDDGLGIEKPAAVHERCGEHFSNAVPDSEGDLVTLSGKG